VSRLNWRVCPRGRRASASLVAQVSKTCCSADFSVARSRPVRKPALQARSRRRWRCSAGFPAGTRPTRMSASVNPDFPVGRALAGPGARRVWKPATQRTRRCGLRWRRQDAPALGDQPILRWTSPGLVPTVRAVITLRSGWLPYDAQTCEEEIDSHPARCPWKEVPEQAGALPSKDTGGQEKACGRTSNLQARQESALAERCQGW
jgi:hypothetical protein